MRATKGPFPRDLHISRPFFSLFSPTQKDRKRKPRKLEHVPTGSSLTDVSRRVNVALLSVARLHLKTRRKTQFSPPPVRAFPPRRTIFREKSSFSRQTRFSRFFRDGGKPSGKFGPVFAVVCACGCFGIDSWRIFPEVCDGGRFSHGSG